jgi:hypothetical protein
MKVPCRHLGSQTFAPREDWPMVACALYTLSIFIHAPKIRRVGNDLE